MRIKLKGGRKKCHGNVFLSHLLKEQNEVNCHVDIYIGSFILTSFTSKEFS